MIAFALILLLQSLMINFQQLSEIENNPHLHKQDIEINGFLYCNANQEWVLASEPNLKSCCIGAGKKASQQIFLDRAFPEINNGQAVAMQGVLLVQPVKNNQNEVVQLYQLQDSSLIVKEHSWKLLAIVLVVLIVVFLGFLFITKGAKS
jgi:hypothetical protein